jgi:hypothetical protein
MTRSSPVTTEPTLKRVQMLLCTSCLDGIGEECHTPGCAMYLHRVDLPFPKDTYTEVADAAATTSEPAAWRYQGKNGWGGIWRCATVKPTFETPDDWIVEPLFTGAAQAKPDPVPTAWLVDGPAPLDSSEVFLTHDKALEAFNDWGKRITPLYAFPSTEGK